MKTPATNTIAAFCLVCAVGLMVFLFSASRNDPALRIAALVAGTGLVASLAAIASTILTGKDLTQRPSDLPPGGSMSQQTRIEVPPVPDPNAQVVVVDPNVPLVKK